MGGNALKTKRLQANEYKELEKSVYEKLQQAFPDTRIHIPKYFSSKESFGDMDILFERNDELSNIMDKVKDLFKPEKTYYNKESSFSFEQDNFQIDLIFIKPESFDFAKEYFSYNDLGIFIGRIADSFGVKYGIDGLYYTLGKIQNNHNFFQNKDRIYITKDFKSAIDVLGFDYNRYQKGFDNMQEIFDFVTSSKYFTKASYQRENQNNDNYHRNKKRKNFTDFQSYLENKFEDKNMPFDYYREIGMNIIDRKFPEFKSKYEKYKKDCEENAIFSTRFNGRRIIGLTGIDQMEVSSVIAHFKAIPNLKQKVLSLNDSEVDAFILKEMESMTIVKKPPTVRVSQKKPKAS